MAVDDSTTRAEWMESARRRLVETIQLGTELLGQWEFLNNEERTKGLAKVEGKLNDTIIMVKGRTVFKNGD